MTLTIWKLWRAIWNQAFTVEDIPELDDEETSVKIQIGRYSRFKS